MKENRVSLNNLMFSLDVVMLRLRLR